jgi:hypothetical protein
MSLFLLESDLSVYEAKKFLRFVGVAVFGGFVVCRLEGDRRGAGKWGGEDERCLAGCAGG